MNDISFVFPQQDKHPNAYNGRKRDTLGASLSKVVVTCPPPLRTS